jgi:hypothetical protein
MLCVYFTYVHFVSSITLSFLAHLFQHMIVHQTHSFLIAGLSLTVDWTVTVQTPN